jgi:hypothetical protein
MEGSISSVTLKCLNCGANLRIGAKVVEFACEYCGASQAVEREGGVVCLRLLSAKIDYIKDTVDRTAAGLAIHRLNGELDDLEEKYNRLEGAHINQKEMVKQLFWGLFVVAFVSGLLVSAYAGSLVPVVLFAFAGGIGLFFLRRFVISGMIADFEKASKNLIEGGVEIRKRINNHERIVNA